MDATPIPEPLCLGELVKSMHIEVRGGSGAVLCHGVVAALVDGDEPQIVLHDISHYGRETAMLACEMGLKPRPDGSWSEQRSYPFTDGLDHHLFERRAQLPATAVAV